MNLFNTILILAMAFLVVFLEALFGGTRRWLGAQVELLPALMVYTSLTGGLLAMCLLAVWGGLFLDSLSANPLGVTILPLLVAGLIIYRFRSLILRDQIFAQITLGAAASAAVPLMTLISLSSLGAAPLIRWGSLWQWFVMSVAGAIATPFFFWILDRSSRALNYQPVSDRAYRRDREIKRSRI